MRSGSWTFFNCAGGLDDAASRDGFSDFISGDATVPTPGGAPAAVSFLSVPRSHVVLDALVAPWSLIQDGIGVRAVMLGNAEESAL